MDAARRPAEALGAQLLAIGLIATITAVGVQTVAHWINAFLLDGSFWNLDADAEGNAFTWASSAATSAAALGAGLWAVAFAERRRGFVVLAAILLLFSLDDVVQLHEHTALEFGDDVLGWADYVAVRLWTIFYLPLLAVAGYLLWQLPAVLWPPAARFVRGGLAFLVAAFVVEIVGLATRWLEEERDTAWPEAIRNGIEEGIELAGWMLIATGLLTAVCVALSSGGGAREAT